jgi:hypothetical protein
MEKEKKTGVILNSEVTRIIIGLTELGNLDIEDFKTNYQIAKTINNLGMVEKAINKTIESFKKKHISLGEDGNYKVENNSYVFKSKEDKDNYISEIEKIQDATVDTKIFTIKESELKKIKGLKGTTMAKLYELIEHDETKD